MILQTRSLGPLGLGLLSSWRPLDFVLRALPPLRMWDPRWWPKNEICVKMCCCFFLNPNVYNETVILRLTKLNFDSTLWNQFDWKLFDHYSDLNPLCGCDNLIFLRWDGHFAINNITFWSMMKPKSPLWLSQGREFCNSQAHDRDLATRDWKP